MDILRKVWPLIATAVLAIAPMLSTHVQAFWVMHPTIVAGLFGVWATFKWLLPSPVAPPVTPPPIQ